MLRFYKLLSLDRHLFGGKIGDGASYVDLFLNFTSIYHH